MPFSENLYEICPWSEHLWKSKDFFHTTVLSTFSSFHIFCINTARLIRNWTLMSLVPSDASQSSVFDVFHYFLPRDLLVLKCSFQWQLLLLRNETYHSCQNRRHLCLQDIGNIEGIAADTWRPGSRKSTSDFINFGCLSSFISWFLKNWHNTWKHKFTKFQVNVMFSYHHFQS